MKWRFSNSAVTEINDWLFQFDALTIVTVTADVILCFFKPKIGSFMLGKNIKYQIYVWQICFSQKQNFKKDVLNEIWYKIAEISNEYTSEFIMSSIITMVD